MGLAAFDFFKYGLVVMFDNKQIFFRELPKNGENKLQIEEAIKKDIKDKGIEGKEISVYVNVEQKAAYYTVDGQGSDDYRIDLNTL